MNMHKANPEFDPIFLDALAFTGEAEFTRHQEQRKDWSYHDILTRDKIAELAEQPPIEIDKWTTYAYLGNLVVEEGIPEYNRITAGAFQQHPVFCKWKNEWVAEEKQHGQAMVEYAKVRGLIDMARVHNTIRGYLQNGLSLHFDDAAFGFAYPALQEPATKITHREVKDRLPKEEKEGRIILAKIIGDEERHERFYANMVRHALDSDDKKVASHQMRAIARAVLGFEMPGIERDIPGGMRITAAYAKSGAFTIGKVAREVLLPAIYDHGEHGWDIANRTNLDDDAKAAQEALVNFSESLLKAQDDDKELSLILLSSRKKITT